MVLLQFCAGLPLHIPALLCNSGMSQAPGYTSRHQTWKPTGQPRPHAKALWFWVCTGRWYEGSATLDRLRSDTLVSCARVTSGLNNIWSGSGHLGYWLHFGRVGWWPTFVRGWQRNRSALYHPEDYGATNSRPSWTFFEEWQIFRVQISGHVPSWKTPRQVRP